VVSVDDSSLIAYTDPNARPFGVDVCPVLTYVLQAWWHQLGRSGTPLPIVLPTQNRTGQGRTGPQEKSSVVQLLFIMADGDSGQRTSTFPVDVHATIVTAMHVPPPCSGTGHTGILCSQEAPGSGHGIFSHDGRLSAHLQCWE